jgi:hypothetical protein
MAQRALQCGGLSLQPARPPQDEAGHERASHDLLAPVHVSAISGRILEVSWYAISNARKLAKINEPIDPGHEERKGPYRWLIRAWWQFGGSWTRLVKISGEYWIVTTRIEREAK